MSVPSTGGEILELGGDAESSGPESALWQRFTASASAEAYCQAWLGLLCAQVDRALAALVLLEAGGAFAPAAVWPHRERDVTHLRGAAEESLRTRRGLVRRAAEAGGEGAGDHVAYPLEMDGSVQGVVVLEVGPRPREALQQVLRQLHWGIAWLEVMLRREAAVRDAAARDRVFTVLDLVGVAVAEERFQAACTALVTELAARLDCDRVSLGFRRGRGLRVQAISHSATFGRRMNLVRLLEAAMDEAADQEATVRYPPAEDASVVSQAHGALAQQQGAPEICTVPVPARGRLDAAFTLERPRGRPFDDDEVALVEALGELACPGLVEKREGERWLATKAVLAARRQLGRLLGPRHLVRKLVALGLLAAVAFLSVATGQYRVSADATVEGGHLRAIVAPFNGYIATAPQRAGETVPEGTVLATLDDRDLRLEQVRLTTERAQYVRERRQAVAGNDRARARILTAQIQQAEAQLDLIEAQLARTRLAAPFDGILVSGDLSQSLGAPVQRGDVLFELAPRGSYRVRLAVDERDLDDVRAGQAGTLVVSALPDTPIPLVVRLVTPVTRVEAGRNVFTVEAEPASVPARLRPGMEGVAKLDVGERRLVWIWTRALVHWLRMQAWAWTG